MASVDFTSVSAEGLQQVFPDLGLFTAEDIVGWRDQNHRFPDEAALLELGLDQALASSIAAAAKETKEEEARPEGAPEAAPEGAPDAALEGAPDAAPEPALSAGPPSGELVRDAELTIVDNLPPYPPLPTEVINASASSEQDEAPAPASVPAAKIEETQPVEVAAARVERAPAEEPVEAAPAKVEESAPAAPEVVASAVSEGAIPIAEKTPATSESPKPEPKKSAAVRPRRSWITVALLVATVLTNAALGALVVQTRKEGRRAVEPLAPMASEVKALGSVQGEIHTDLAETRAALAETQAKVEKHETAIDETKRAVAKAEQDRLAEAHAAKEREAAAERERAALAQRVHNVEKKTADQSYSLSEALKIIDHAQGGAEPAR